MGALVPASATAAHGGAGGGGGGGEQPAAAAASALGQAAMVPWHPGGAEATAAAASSTALVPLADAPSASSVAAPAASTGTAATSGKVGLQRLGTIVRAEGRLATAAVASSVPQELPHRAVVRGKEARRLLQGFDCEQCRHFYQVTGVMPVGCSHEGGPNLAASRHRYKHAPTHTPEGFWELSFPRDPVATRQPEPLEYLGKVPQT